MKANTSPPGGSTRLDQQKINKRLASKTLNLPIAFLFPFPHNKLRFSF